MVRQLGLHSGVAMEVTGRCAEPSDCDRVLYAFSLALPGVGSRIVTTPFVAVADDGADVLPCTVLLWFARHLL